MLLTLWLLTVGNIPLWLSLWRLPEMHTGRAALGGMGLAVALLGFLLATLALLVWPRWLKPAGLLLLITVTLSSYFMNTYGVVIDRSMIANTVNTDMREVLDLLSVKMALALLLGVVLPGWWWWRQQVQTQPLRVLLPRQIGLALLALLVAFLALWLSFQDLASLMRNHKDVRYTINPYNTVFALARHGMGQAQRVQQPLQALGEDAHVASPASPTEAPLIVVVVGETARAANFGLGGYTRDTTPQTQALQKKGDLVYFPQVSSCGTSTEASVPCMFSHLGREAYTASDSRYENLLDVLQRAGLSVFWLDNQSGCKGVCDRVPHANTRDAPGACQGGECDDMALLQQLPQQLANLSPSATAHGTVAVLHQMGSHGPAYYKRSPQNLKAFLPECTSHTLQDCAEPDIVNAYDNSLRSTDALLASTIAWLATQSRPTALLYVSDHGESLGEKGLYLHGMPYRLAPVEQTHVPMLTWLSPGMQKRLKIDMPCLQKNAQAPWSHDNLFHSVLDLARVETRVLESQKSVFTGCNKVRS